jgi:AAA domain (dynein-related subfamily)/CbbQ/NirQ/NorQ C-terminal
LNIEKTISLTPLGVLNTVLAENNVVTTTNKTEAVNAVLGLINSGKVTVDQVRAKKASPVASVGIPDDVRKQIIEAQTQVNNALSQVETIRKVADMNLDQALQQSTKLEKQFNDLALRLNAKVDAVETPDAKLISDTIRVEVSKLFDSFRASSPKEVVAKVAQSIPRVTRKPVRDVFAGQVLAYDFEGEHVDFSGLAVEVWDDPNAPELVADYVFDPRHLHQALCALNDPLPDNVWLAGERGTGKTEFVNQIANRLGRRLFRINFDEAMERAEFIGGNTIEKGNVVWKAGVLVQAIKHTGAIVLLDELGFARAQSLASLHAPTERSPHRSIVIAETGERFPVASHVAFFCADNSNGYGDQSGNFAGVRDQNTAFIDRFSYTLEFDYLPQAEEVALISKRTGLQVDATEVLVKFANVAREKARAGILTQPPSLRQLFAWARAITKGVPVGLAFNSAIVKKFPADCEAELRGIYSATIDVNNLKSYLSKGV